LFETLIGTNVHFKLLGTIAGKSLHLYKSSI